MKNSISIVLIALAVILLAFTTSSEVETVKPAKPQSIRIKTFNGRNYDTVEQQDATINKYISSMLYNGYILKSVEPTTYGTVWVTMEKY